MANRYESVMGELADLYAHEFRGMVRLATLLCGSDVIATDVVHEAFLKLHDNWKRAKKPGAYLRQIVVNECTRVHRRKAVEDKHAPMPQSPQLLPELDETWHKVQALPPKQRTVVVLRFYEDLSIAQIAEVTGARAGTVKSQLHRGLATLKISLTNSSETTQTDAHLTAQEVAL